MKRFTRYFNFKIQAPLLAILLFLFAFVQSSAQQAVTRVYATGDEEESGTFGNVTDNGNAKDGNLTTASTFSIGVIGSRSQRISFPSAVTNKPIHIKLGSGSGLVTLFPTITVQAYNGGDGDGVLEPNNRVGPASVISSTSLLYLLSGTNTYEHIFTPSTTLPYDRIRVTFSAISVGAVSIKLYDAYYENNATSSIQCDTYVDVYSGSNGSLASSLTTVSNPFQAVNNDETDFAELFAVASAANYTGLTVLYPGTSRTGDSVRVLIENPAALISLGVLNETAIKTYNGGNPTPVDNFSDFSLLHLQLLGASTKGWLSFASSGPFDRITVEIGGVVGAVTSLKVYEVQRVAKAPTIAVPNYTIYSGHSVTITSAVSGSDGVLWSPGGQTTLAINTGTLTSTSVYEVQATRAGCLNLSSKAKSTVTVLPLPTYTSPTAFIQGQAYNIGSGKAILITGGQPGSSYTFTNIAVAGDIPDGLFISEAGVITGTPTESTPTTGITFTADVTDATLSKPVQTGITFTIIVYPPLVLPPGSFPTTYQGSGIFSVNISSLGSTATGGKGSGYSYSLTPVVLPGGRLAVAGVPSGFTLSPSGVLSGDPAGKADTYTFLIYANDGVQQTSAEFTLLITSSPLPVKLTSFKASKEGQTAVLNWTTTEETNSDRFDLERSANGKKWEVIAQKVSSGESTVLKNYFLSDNSPLNGENLYRLKMIDLDGSFAYSHIESLNFGVKNRIYPNPVTSGENLQIDVADWSKVSAVKMTNAIGKTVFESSQVLSTGINTSDFTPGLYIVQVMMKNGTLTSYKIIKK